MMYTVNFNGNYNETLGKPVCSTMAQLRSEAKFLHEAGSQMFSAWLVTTDKSNKIAYQNTWWNGHWQA